MTPTEAMIVLLVESSSFAHFSSGAIPSPQKAVLDEARTILRDAAWAIMKREGDLKMAGLKSSSETLVIRFGQE